MADAASPSRKRLGSSDLPRRKYKFSLHVLVVRKNTGAPLLCHRTCQEPRRLGCLALDMGQDILQVRLLAPYAVHPHAANRIADQPQPRPSLNGLLLLRVAREYDLRSMALGELENVMRLAGRQHPRFIDDNGGILVNLDSAPRGEAQQLVDAERPRIDVVTKRHRRAPGHGRGDNVLSLFTVEIGDRPQCRGLARACRPFNDGDPALG